MPDDGRPAALLLRGVDRAAFATAFAVRLRQHGVPVGLELDALTYLPFEKLSETEMEFLGQWLEAGLLTWPPRRRRRRAQPALPT